MRHICLTLALALAAICACAQGSRYCINVGDFNEITVANGINVLCICNPDSAGMAVYECPPDVAPAITFSPKGQKLKVEVVSESPIAQLPTVTVYSTAISCAQNWGDSTLTVLCEHPAAQFKANVIGNGFIVAKGLRVTKASASVKAGNGRIYMQGRAQEAKYTIMSAGAIEAFDLEAQKVSCSMVGTGSIDCSPSERLKVTGMGSGSVFYTGNPPVKNHSVGVKVVQME